jgi:hypothetical protein
MIHLLALNICDDYLLKLINKISVEQTLDIEVDTDNDLEGKTFEFDDEYLVNDFTNFYHHSDFFTQEFQSISSFQYLQSALPQSIQEILIPPPRA